MEIIHYLIDHGADDRDGGLYNASGDGHFEIVKLMVKKGATDLNPGVLYSKKRGHTEIEKYLTRIIINNNLDFEKYNEILRNC